MRIASWIVGALLAITGLVFISFAVVFLVTFRPESVLAGPQWGKRLTGGLPALVVGIGFILAGWYFFRLDLDNLDEVWHPSRFAPFFIAHRRELKFIAQVGLVISLIRLGGACFGVDWLGRWADWTIGPVGAGLFLIAIWTASGRMDHLDWNQVPEQIRQGLKIVWNVAVPVVLAFALLFAWGQARHHVFSQLVKAGYTALVVRLGNDLFHLRQFER
ncbi:MAG TPA: hypothetical protein VK724_04780 [Bryobacteraceae bacterium]|nr:hypothetical protein [Bryobacteraceae bacterium]